MLPLFLLSVKGKATGIDGHQFPVSYGLYRVEVEPELIDSVPGVRKPQSKSVYLPKYIYLYAEVCHAVHCMTYSSLFNRYFKV